MRRPPDESLLLKTWVIAKSKMKKLKISKITMRKPCVSMKGCMDAVVVVAESDGKWSENGSKRKFRQRIH
jgi:hypothetical protein